MKFEIDISDPKKLRQQRSELHRLLNIVDFALAQHTSHQGNGHVAAPELPLPLPRPAIASTKAAAVQATLQQMPRRFTTTDMVIAMGDEGKPMRTAIKFGLRAAVKKGRIRLINTGVGRKPNEYEKV